MPLYDYKCRKCDTVIEVNQSINDKGPTECQEEGCDGKVRKVFLSAPIGVLHHMRAQSMIDTMRSNIR